MRLFGHEAVILPCQGAHGALLVSLPDGLNDLFALVLQLPTVSRNLLSLQSSVRTASPAIRGDDKSLARERPSSPLA